MSTRDIAATVASSFLDAAAMTLESERAAEEFTRQSKKAYYESAHHFHERLRPQFNTVLDALWQVMEAVDAVNGKKAFNLELVMCLSFTTPVTAANKDSLFPSGVEAYGIQLTPADQQEQEGRKYSRVFQVSFYSVFNHDTFPEGYRSTQRVTAGTSHYNCEGPLNLWLPGQFETPLSGTEDQITGQAVREAGVWMAKTLPEQMHAYVKSQRPAGQEVQTVASPRPTPT